MSAALHSLADEPLAQFVDDLYAAWESRRFIFACGNGGSAANAGHFAEDLGKCTIPAGMKDGPRFRVLSLSESPPYLLAWANDEGFESVFVEQLANLASPGDLLVVLSASGRSGNVLRAAEWARRHELTTWALTGSRESPLLQLAERAIRVRSENVGIVETAHLGVIHWVVEELRVRVPRAMGCEPRHLPQASECAEYVSNTAVASHAATCVPETRFERTAGRVSSSEARDSAMRSR
jgi:D-sedoheptulose 7-phosphate isomerase